MEREDGQAAVPVDPARSAMMAKIRSKDTQPEIAVRRTLHGMGFRFRLHRRDLPGTPDIVLPRRRKALFVNGCFWHRHEGCRLAYEPKTRIEFWREKFRRNVERDKQACLKLEAQGWTVNTIWECETRRPDRLRARLGEIMSEANCE